MPKYLLTETTAAKLKELIARPTHPLARAGENIRDFANVVLCGDQIDTEPRPYYACTPQWLPNLDGPTTPQNTEANAYLADLNGGELTPGNYYHIVAGGWVGGIPVFWTNAEGVETTDEGGGSSVAPWIAGLTADDYLLLTVVSVSGKCSTVNADQALYLATSGTDEWTSDGDWEGDGTGPVVWTRVAPYDHTMTIDGISGFIKDRAGDKIFYEFGGSTLCTGEEATSCNNTFVVALQCAGSAPTDSGTSESPRQYVVDPEGSRDFRQFVSGLTSPTPPQFVQFVADIPATGGLSNISAALTSPSGTTFNLFAAPVDATSGTANFVLNPSSGNAIQDVNQSVGPIAGIYSPVDNFTSGAGNPNGFWTLSVTNAATGAPITISQFTMGFGAPSPPTITSANIASDGTTLTLGFSAAAQAVSSWGSNVTLSGDQSATATYVSGNGTNTVTFSLDTTILDGSTVTVGVLAGAFQDAVGNQNGTISGETVTNGSTETAPCCSGSDLAGHPDLKVVVTSPITAAFFPLVYTPGITVPTVGVRDAWYYTSGGQSFYVWCDGGDPGSWKFHTQPSPSGTADGTGVSCHPFGFSVSGGGFAATVSKN